MRKWVLIAVAVVLALPLLAVGALLALTPKARAPSTEKVEATPARLARGEYLVKHVSGCLECHTQHDYAKLGAPESGPPGGGGMCLGEADGFPGHLCTPNISSDPTAGIGAWTDGEVMRAIREGVSKDGRALFPMMPYEKYRHMSDEDLRSVVAYVRTLKPVSTPIARPQLRFPVSLLIRLAPAPVESEVKAPAATEGVLHGEYLATIGGCDDCHTPREKGKPLPGMQLAGGQTMKGPWGEVVTANITPDVETGIGAMTRAQFIARFQAMAALPTDAPAPAATRTVMPWRTYGGMTASDLGSLYDYLRTVPRVHHKVQSFPAAQAQR